MSTRHTVAGVVLCAAVGLTGACGLPSSSNATTVPDGEVPYGLIATATPSAPADTTTATPGATLVEGAVFLANGDQLLVGSPVQVVNTSLLPLVQTMLNRLAVGPNERDRGRGLVTDLAPGSSLIARSLDDGVLTVEWQTASQDPNPAKLPVAVGQVVLTATHVQGVGAVQFVRDGRPLSVPGPTDGELTVDPLTASEYAGLLAPGVDSPATAAPLTTAGSSAISPGSSATG